MKRTIALALILVALTAVGASAQESRLPRVGIQADSDALVGLVLRLDSLEVGAKVQATVYDSSAENATFANQILGGAHVAYLFGDQASGRQFGVGFDVRTAVGIEDVEYDEFIDAAPRLSVDQFLGSRAYVSAIVYPFLLQTRDVADVEEDWQLTLTVPRGAIALTVLF